MEWYCDYKHLSNCIELYGEKYHTFLILGCGDSNIAANMNNDGYMDVMQMDISQTLMKNLGNTENSKNTENLLMDVFSLSFLDNSIDMMIDKGTLDAIFCGSPLDENDENQKSYDGIFDKFIHEINRCLCKNGGIYMLITMYPEQIILPKLKSIDGINWNITHHMITYSIESLYVRTLKQLTKGTKSNTIPQTAVMLAALKSEHMLKNVNFEQERYKLPDVSKICHIYICKKGQI